MIYDCIHALVRDTPHGYSLAAISDKDAVRAACADAVAEDFRTATISDIVRAVVRNSDGEPHVCQKYSASYC